MAKTMKRLGEPRDNVEADSINVEKYVKELSVVTMDLTKACRRMFVNKNTSGSSRCFRRRETVEEAEEVSTKVLWSTKSS